ncbi:hypothetical protein LIA77_11390 [Sarocladium implicatum]|nr:hypothetical protein LIA77_11390 [Sarocladium implicatum]
MRPVRSHSMARKPSLLSLLLLICFQAVTSATRFQLTDEILQFIPDCSRECFLSFLDVNFEDNPCDAGTTSLQCLCSARGASGFTIGEGLVQCIAAEKAIEFCTPEESSDEVFIKAFGMCNGKPNAIPATASIFTATLVLPPSGPGVVSFPPLTTTRTDLDDETTTSTTARSTSTTIKTTLETETSQPPRTTSRETSSSFSTTVRSSATDDSAITEGPVPDIPAGDDGDGDGADQDGADGGSGDDDGDNGLVPAQVAGISVGVASAAGIAAIAIVIARYYRRQRQFPDVRSLFSKRNTWPYPEKGIGGGPGDPDGSGSMAGIARQINQPLDKGPGPSSGPPAYEGAAGYYSPATIGVAVASPSDTQPGRGGTTPGTRPLSRLLPAKPVYLPPSSSGAPTPLTAEPFGDTPMVTSPNRRGATSPLGTSTFTSQRQQNLNPPPGVNNQTRQASPDLSGSTAIQQQSPRGYSPGFVTAQGSPKPRLQPQTARGPPAANINKPQPPVPKPSVNELYAPPPAVIGRDSNVTEFEEDGGLSSRSTGVSTTNNGVRGSKPRQGSMSGQVWVPPSGHPISGLTYYFADQSGNWVLRDSQIGQKMQQQQQQQQQPYDNQSDIHPALRTNSALRPAAEISRASELSYSPYPQKRQQPQLARQQWPPASSVYSPSMPRPLFSGAPRTSYNRRTSDDSGVTQFSAASSSGELEAPVPPANLSPVVESPPERARRGVYPSAGNIGRNQNNLRLASGPPPSARQYHPPGQPSPTLGLMVPAPVAAQARGMPNSSYQRPQDYPPPNRPYNSNTVANSSQPTTLRAVSPSPPPDRDLLPSAQHANDIVSPLSPVRGNLPFSSQPPMSNYNNRTTSGPWRPPNPQGPTSPRSSANTTTSSLLSKRLGPDRAADMSFPSVQAPSTQRKWEQYQRQGPNGYLSPETPSRATAGQQPMTPTWVPRLTPTRRGDDLYLNVQ